jgi:ADP-ribose pyrophosphatase
MLQQMKRLRRRVVTADKWLTHNIDTVQLPSGKILETQHFISFPTHSVAVILEDQVGNVLLVRTLRYPSNTLEWEIPAGSLEVGEDPEDAVKREVLEETGLTVSACSLLWSFQPMNDLTNKVISIYMGIVLPGNIKIDTDEISKARWFSPDELQHMVLTNEIKDAATLLGLLRYWW